VFLPMRVFSGSTGVISDHFSVTVVASMLLSVRVALTISPAMCRGRCCQQGGHAAPAACRIAWFNRASSAWCTLPGRRRAMLSAAAGSSRTLAIGGADGVGCCYP